MALRKQAHRSWQQVVQAYSTRTLTNDSDKLMTVMGISRFTGEIMQDKFLAGLWQGMLWQGMLWKDLLWSCESTTSLRLTGINLPAWSWDSISGNVTYKLPAGSSQEYIKSMLKLLSEDLQQNTTSGDVTGRLSVSSKLSKVWRRSQSGFEASRLYHKELIRNENMELSLPTENDKEIEIFVTPSAKGSLKFAVALLIKWPLV